MNNNLELIKSMITGEVFQTWKGIEKNVEHWKPFYTSKNFKSWEEWRKKTHGSVLEKNLIWNLYKVTDPLKTIPEYRGGMFHSWSKWFYQQFPEKPPRLKDLLTHPGVHNHWYIREIASNFKDKETILTAIKLPSGDICVIEGMHRACAITMIANDKTPINFEVKVMIADWPDENSPKLGSGWDKDKQN